MDKNFKGIGASSGIVISKVFLLQDPKFDLSACVFTDANTELKNYQTHCSVAIKQLEEVITLASKKLSEEKAAVFHAHIQLITDEEICKEISETITKHKKPEAVAIESVYQKYYEMFAAMDDPYFKERASDILDVKKRLLSQALNLVLPDLLSINYECVIVAHDLAPSETTQLDPKFVKGFLTNIGGRTSHAAIMARTMEIPAVVSLKNITTKVKNNDIIALDGSSGMVELINSPTAQAAWTKKIKDYQTYHSELQKYKHVQPITLDGHKVLIEGNIGHPNDVAKVMANGGGGIGLFRSEFLYMDSDNWPTEEEQFVSYKTVLEQVKNHQVIIRTLDIGGDKHLSYFKFPHEINPFLGYRALRLSLGHREMFRTQLRALLRASAFGHLGVMLPMVATLEEFLTAKNLINQLSNELRHEGHKVSDNYQVGMMIEIPTAAVFAQQFAKYANFFSIGSNDLIQYSMAVDRMSEEVNYLYQPNFPGLLTMIKLAIDGAHSHKNRKLIGMCGEMAGEPYSIPLLLGLGLDAFSMSASSIPIAKYIISKVKLSDCQTLVKKCLILDDQTSVNKLVKDFFSIHQIILM